MSDQNKTIAIVSYLTIIGWVIAFILRQNEQPQRELSRFHLRQSFGINLLGFALSLVQYVIYMLHLSFIIKLLSLGIFVLWIIGLISAIQGKFNPVPLVGKWFEEQFTFIR